MKHLYFVFLLSSFIGTSQIVNIPDPAFKGELIAHGMDLNSDGDIQDTEAAQVTELTLIGAGISDLTGIQSFTNLEFLNCNDNALTSLDLTGLTNIRFLFFSNNPIATFSYSPSPAWYSLTCINTALTALDCTGMSNLYGLVCTENNELLTINSNGLSVLGEAALGNCPLLSSISMSGCPSLVSMNLDQGLPSLTSANFSGCSSLQYFESSYANNLETLDVSNCTSLQYLAILDNSGNSLANLNINGCISLIDITLGYCKLTSIDISLLPNIHMLYLPFNQLTEVNLKNGTDQVGVFMGNDNLAFICVDASEETALQQSLLDEGMSAVAVDPYCTFVPGGGTNAISGTVFYDNDGDGCGVGVDSIPFNIQMNLSGSGSASYYVNSQGTYSFYVGAGSYQVTPHTENDALFSFTPASAAANFTGPAGFTTSQDFCVAPLGVQPDIEAVIVPLSNAVPGFQSVYNLTYKNKGNQTINGNVTFSYDESRLDFTSATTSPDVQSAGLIQWNYTNLQPFEARSVKIVLHVNAPTDSPAVNSGDSFDYVAVANPVVGDILPVDNTFNFHQVAVNGFDPNDKVCAEGDSVPTEKIGDYLHYVINFENTGTAVAQNIVIKDIIDTARFDVSTLQIISTSHPAAITLSGSKAEFVFEGIQLAPTARGYAAFKIKTLPSLATGDTATNKADIYFDYNFPVETNMASTLFQSLSVVNHSVDSNLRVYPNPTANCLYVTSAANLRSVTVYDFQGRLLQMQLCDGSEAVVDLSKQATGIYLLHISTEKGVTTQQVIRQ